MRRLLLALPAVILPSLALAQTAPPPAPAPITVTFTSQEAQVLLNLLDTAVKSCGIQCAGNAAVLAGKLQAAAQAPPPAAEPAK